MKQTNETNKVTEQRAPDEMWKIFFQEHAEHRQEDHYEKGKLYQNSPISLRRHISNFLHEIHQMFNVDKEDKMFASLLSRYLLLP